MKELIKADMRGKMLKYFCSNKKVSVGIKIIIEDSINKKRF